MPVPNEFLDRLYDLVSPAIKRAIPPCQPEARQEARAVGISLLVVGGSILRGLGMPIDVAAVEFVKAWSVGPQAPFSPKQKTD